MAEVLILQGETPQGEIVTELTAGNVILVHGIGLMPFTRTGLRGTWRPQVTHRMWAERLAKQFVVEPRLVLTDHTPSGRIYAVLSLHR